MLINLKWCNYIFKKKFNSLTRLQGDASARTYYRLSDTTTSYILSYGVPNPRFLAIQKLLLENNIPIPKIYQQQNLLGKEYLLLEDLGNTSLVLYLLDSNELTTYQKVIDLLIKMQKIDFVKYSIDTKFDDTTLLKEVKFAITYFKPFFKKNYDYSLIEDGFSKICKIIAAHPMILTHRDFHGRNIMIKNDQIYFIDFQDARWGHPLYDLVSLIEDSYFKISCKSKLKEYYFNNFYKDLGSLDDFNYYYDLIALQRIFKALGSFIYLYQKKGKIRYLSYLSMAFENLKYFLTRHPEFGIEKTIMEIYYAN